jgi:hypothetical protein
LLFVYQVRDAETGDYEHNGDLMVIAAAIPAR